MNVTQPVLSNRLRFRLVALSIVTSLALVFAIIVIVFLTVEGFTGIASQKPLVLNTCPHVYYSNKYGSLNQRIRTVFIASSVSLILQIVLCVLIFPPLIMRVRPPPSRLQACYLLVSLHLLAVVIDFSTFLSFHVDFNAMGTTCSVTFTSVLIPVILAIVSAGLFISLLQYFFSIWCIKALHLELSNEQVYSVVNNITNTAQNIEDSQQIQPRENHKNPHQAYLREYLERLEQERPKLPVRPIETAFQSPERPRRQSIVYSSINELSNKPGNYHKTNYKRDELRNEAEPGKIRHQKKSNFSEDSFESMAKQERANYEKMVNQPGPIEAAAKQTQLQRVNRTTQGYLKFARRMSPQYQEPEAELVTIIKGKESRLAL